MARGASAPDQDPAVMVGAREAVNTRRRSLREATALDELLDGSSRMEFLLRYTLAHPGIHTTIVGTMNREHFTANVLAAEKGPLDDDVYTEAARRLMDGVS